MPTGRYYDLSGIHVLLKKNSVSLADQHLFPDASSFNLANESVSSVIKGGSFLPPPFLPALVLKRIINVALSILPESGMIGASGIFRRALT